MPLIPAMQRTLFTEQLDFLPAHDARARRSRRDLRRINRWMGNDVWWRRAVAPLINVQDRVLEIGPGDGGFRPLPDHVVDGLDRMPVPDRWHPEARWYRMPAQSFSKWADYSAIVGNLVFHHFTEAELHHLGSQIAPHVRIIAACEPQRGRRCQFGFVVLARLLGACTVTRRDGYVSILAGFRGDELPHALGLDPRHWGWTIEQTWRGAYRLLAIRHA